MRVGDIIHKLRKECKMTLLELSEKSGVALATLSRVENNKMTGTLDSHISISKALGIDLPDLYKDIASAKKIIELHPKKIKADIGYSKRSVREVLTSGVSSKKMMPVLIKISKAGATASERSKSGAEKFIYIVSGKVRAGIGEEKYDLSEGDTLYFDASTPHHFRNTGSTEARVISVTCPSAL